MKEKIINLILKFVKSNPTPYDPPYMTGVKMAAAELEKLYPRWIPVSERLPEEKGIYLGYFGGRYGFEDEPICTCIFNGKKIHLNFPNSTSVYDIPTHWMPLPEGPENLQKPADIS